MNPDNQPLVNFVDCFMSHYKDSKWDIPLVAQAFKAGPPPFLALSYVAPREFLGPLHWWAGVCAQHSLLFFLN